MAEKRAFGVFSVRAVVKGARAAHAPSEIVQLYAASLSFMAARSELIVTDTASEGSYAPTLFTNVGYELWRAPLVGSRVNKV